VTALIAFLAAMSKPLLDFATALYERHGGDVAAAKAELKKIPDAWATWDSEQARIDAALEVLSKKQ
jgi:hypothetical protein